MFHQKRQQIHAGKSMTTSPPTHQHSIWGWMWMKKAIARCDELSPTTSRRSVLQQPWNNQQVQVVHPHFFIWICRHTWTQIPIKLIKTKRVTRLRSSNCCWFFYLLLKTPRKNARPILFNRISFALMNQSIPFDVDFCIVCAWRIFSFCERFVELWIQTIQTGRIDKKKLHKVSPHQTESRIQFPERKGKHFYHFTFDRLDGAELKETPKCWWLKWKWKRCVYG